MSANRSLGPFRPGPGRPPPHLAGRTAEQRYFQSVLRQLADGAPPPSEVVLYGPRGNGKTALLHWLEDEAKSHPGVEVERRTPAELPDRARLAAEFVPRSWWNRHAPSRFEAFGVSWRPGRKRPPAIRETLAARSKKNPLVLLLDEAHTLTPEVGRELLNASQIVGTRQPLLLVLAGTPNLRSHLNAMDVSFWNRARQFRIGRLDDDNAAAALANPFQDEEKWIDREARRKMVRESQGYPFFIQLLGQAVWERLVASDMAGVTPDILEAALPEFEETKGDYYLHRFDELRGRGFLPVGRAVAEAFAERELLRDEDLEGAIARALGRNARPKDLERATGNLSDLGFIWRAQGRPEWEPGIPSLMDFIREHAPAG